MSGKVTLADVASAAGVSKMTASRAMRGAADVSAKTIEKVREIAAELGYTGNHLAASLSNNRSDLIGVVVPSLSNIVFAEVMSGIDDAISGSGLQPFFGVTGYDTDKEFDIVRRMLSWQPAGLIVTGLDQSEITRKLLSSAETPVVQIMDTDGDPVDICVGFSQTEAGAGMAQRLIAQGRTRFGYVGCGLGRDTRAAKRHEGFKSALATAGFALSEVQNDALSSVATGKALTAELLRNHPDLDAIYYSNDDVAVGGLFYCMEQGIAVPERVLPAGFNGLDLVQNLPAPIATTLTARRDIGAAAARAILESAKDPAKPADKLIEFPVRHVITATSSFTEG